MRRRTGNRVSLFLASTLLTPALLAAQGQRPLPWRPDSLPDSTVVQAPPIPGGPAAIFRFLFSTVPQWLQIAGVIVGGIVAIVLAVLLVRNWSAVLTWLRTRSRGYKIALGTTALVLVTSAAAVGMWSWNFMMHDNDFCVGCHVMTSAYQKFGQSEHVIVRFQERHLAAEVVDVHVFALVILDPWVRPLVGEAVRREDDRFAPVEISHRAEGPGAKGNREERALEPGLPAGIEVHGRDYAAVDLHSPIAYRRITCRR